MYHQESDFTMILKMPGAINLDKLSNENDAAG